MGYEAELDYIQNKKLESKQITLFLAVFLKSYGKFRWRGFSLLSVIIQKEHEWSGSNHVYR